MSRLRALSLSVFSFFFCGCFFFTPVAQGQYRASLHGTVTDPSGAVVSGATATLLNPATNQKMVSTSDPSGIYHFNALPPGSYQLTVDAGGFKKKVLDNIRIIPEQANALDVQLEVGKVEETVTVTDATPPIDTATGNITGTISTNQVQNMPSFGRDVFKLLQLTPGMFGDNSQAGGGGGFSLPGTQGPGATGGSTGIFQTENGPQALAAGQQYENNSYSIDGVDTTSAVWGGTTVITPNEESVQDVKVLSNAYDAEYGRYSGAQVQVTSKSGTDKYHGTLFVTAHRPGLNAYQRFNGQNNKVLRDNNFYTQLGGSVGGPIWKNKVFAFFSYETTRSPKAQTSTANGWYETPAFEKLAPNGSIASTYLGFPGGSVQSIGLNNSTCANAGLTEGVNCRTIPGQGLDIGSPLTSALGTQDPGWQSASNPGLGSGLDGVADIANYVTQSTSHFGAAQYNGRVDANITSKDRLAFSMYWVPLSNTFLNGPARAYDLFNHSQINNAFAGIWDRTFSPTLVNEFRVNASGWRWNEVASNPQSPVGLPTDRIDQIGSITLQQFGPNVGSILNQWTYAIKDVATKSAGRHTLKFGGEVTRLYYLNENAGGTVPSYNFFNLWDFLNDAPHSESGRFDPSTGVPTLARQDDRESLVGVFGQDDFKVTRNLTLNLGLRWNYFGPLTSKQGNMFVAIPGSGSNFLTGLTVKRGDSWNAQKNNFGPEIGFAWSPGRSEGKLAIRGGYGLNYNQLELALSANVANNPGLVVNPSFTMATPSSPNPGIVYAVSSNLRSLTNFPANPNAVSSFASNGLPASGAPVNVVIFPQDLPTLRVHHYSLQTEYNFGDNYVMSLSYQGSLSRNLVFHENPNATPAASGFALNPQIGGGDFWNMNGYGNYNAMIAELRHQFSRQFMADFQFTWSKSMDTASGPYYENPYPYNPSLDYGRSDYNVAHAYKIYALWQPRFFHGNNVLDKIAGGWSISGIFNYHTGFPWSPTVSVVGGSLYCGTCGYGSLYPAAYLGGAGTSTSNDQFKTGSNYVNGGTAYFSNPSYTPFNGNSFGPALPQTGLHRGFLTGPNYRDLDMTLTKAFGLPVMPVLGENAKIEFRVDAYNVFNNLNFNPLNISNNIANSNFGQDTGALAGRVVTLGARFNF
ncbi:MAG TPA: carboxypeptidase-like regulatory domain-containing protein [Terriglobales bacterium]|nr:carboxypeptidase-like regulatory domain-containing protein [Terriglobales bacterium]